MSTSTEIPKVTGQHRNRALAAERRRRAVELALRGTTYEQIAAALGYANRGTVYRIVKNALADREVESIDELRGVEVDRLDALQRSVWDRALGGDREALKIVLAVIDRRCRIQGLYSHKASTRPHPPEARVLW